MTLFAWSVGDRITSARLNTPRDLLKNVAGGEDSIVLSSLSAFDASRIPASSFLLPNACVGSSNLVPTVFSTVLTTVAGNQAITTAGYVTALSLTVTSGIFQWGADIVWQTSNAGSNNDLVFTIYDPSSNSQGATHQKAYSGDDRGHIHMGGISTFVAGGALRILANATTTLGNIVPTTTQLGLQPATRLWAMRIG